MSLDKQKLQGVLEKVREADDEQARSIQAELGSFEATDRILEQIERNTGQHATNRETLLNTAKTGTISNG